MFYKGSLALLLKFMSKDLFFTILMSLLIIIINEAAYLLLPHLHNLYEIFCRHLTQGSAFVFTVPNQC